MLHEITSRFSGENFWLRKLYLILVSLAVVSIQINAQPGWTQKADIPTPRGGATAAVVDGKIYLIGGWPNSTNVAINEMYDPSTNTWVTKAPMPTARGFLSSVVMNGVIYVIGGGYPQALRKVEVYDPATNSWTTRKDLNLARTNGRAAVVDGKIYVIAGYPNIQKCEFYDPLTDTWTYFKDFPESSGGVVSVAVYNGLIYVFGGGYGTGLNTLYTYDPKTDTWEKKHDLWTRRTVSQACLVNGKIYLIGGATGENVSSAAVEMYDPATDTWWIKSNMPVASAFLSCAVVNDKIYVFEGTTNWSRGGLRTWEYDPFQGQNGWTEKAPIPTERVGACACVVENKIYVIGGYSTASGDFAVNEVYDPSTDTWQIKSPLPQPRGWPSCSVVNGIIYVIGGGYPTATKRVDTYDPATNTWTRKADMLSVRRSAQACVVDGIIYNIGGNHGVTQPSPACEAYDPLTDTWTAKTSMPTGGGNIAATVYNGSIYTFGGSENSKWTPFSHTFSYNPQTNTWALKQNMPTARFGHQAITIGNKIFVIGGDNNGSNPALDTLEVYYPDSDEWVSREHMPIKNCFFAGTVVDDKVYILGGSNDWGTGTGISQTWEYDPSQDPTETPVELTSFTATANGKEATLNWMTATELNNQGFEIQRKFGGNEFVTVGSVKGHGTTTSPNQYNYVDKLVDPGKYFYRLKQIDYSGTFEYSNEIEVDVRVLDKFTLEQNYPNPFNPTTTIGYVLQEKGNAKLTLLNALGEDIAVLVNGEQEKGFHKVEFDGSKLTSGVYFYQLRAGNFTTTKKLLLLK